MNPADSAYNYIPTAYVCGIFVGLYGLSTRKSSFLHSTVYTKTLPLVLHLGQSIRYRMWWLLPTAILAGIAEVIGWSARLWSSQNPSLRTPFLMQ